MRDSFSELVGKRMRARLTGGHYIIGRLKALDETIGRIEFERDGDGSWPGNSIPCDAHFATFLATDIVSLEHLKEQA
jgi:hypothetical protein